MQQNRESYGARVLKSHHALKVRISQGAVRLVGRVPSIDDGGHAAGLLSYLPGVEDVEDGTTLDPSLT